MQQTATGAAAASPKSHRWASLPAFSFGNYVLIRELNRNHNFKPREKAGSGKLRGTVRGPFRY